MNKSVRIILALLLLISAAFMVAFRKNCADVRFLIGASGSAFVWVFVFVDVLRNKIYNKQFWILSMIILTNLAALIYLIQREHLIRMGEKFGTKGYHNSKFTKDGEN